MSEPSSSPSPIATVITLVPATAADVPALCQLIQALAAYEKLAHEVTGTPENLQQHLFGDRPSRSRWIVSVGLLQSSGFAARLLQTR
jgi:hypothetical protein